jgi:hypothetical protein
LVRQQRLLVHETTHVWQGKNSTMALTYVFSSVLNQGLHGGAAYSYVAGQPWRSYNAEQQASIVEDWFRAGQPKSGSLYPYIVNSRSKGRPLNASISPLATDDGKAHRAPSYPDRGTGLSGV